MWEKVKEIFQKEAISINLSQINKTIKGRIAIEVNNVFFEACFIDAINKCKTDRLYVLLTALDSTLSYPQFTHQKWATFLNGHCLYIDDPTRKEHGLRFHPCFFFGTKEKDYCAYIAKIINKFSNVYGIDKKNITLIGSSNAGFACIRIANILNEVNCIALCPQISIQEYYLRSNKSIFEKEFNVSFDDVDLQRRLFLEFDLKFPNSNIIIYSNVKNGNHLDVDQMNLLHKWFGINMELGYRKINKNLSIILTNLDAALPHLAQPGISFVKYIDENILTPPHQFDETTIDGFVEDLKILFSTQKMLYVAKLNLSWDSLLQKFMSNLPAEILADINLNRNFQRFRIKMLPDYIYYEFIYNKSSLFFSLNINKINIEKNKNLLKVIANSFGGKISISKDRAKIYREITLPKENRHIDALNSILNTYQLLIKNAQSILCDQ